MTSEEQTYGVRDLLLAFQRRHFAHDFYANRYKAFAKAFGIDLEHPPPERLISPPAWFLNPPTRWDRITFGDASATEVIEQRQLKAHDLFELFNDLANVKHDYSGVGTIDFGEETTGEVRPPEVEQLFSNRYEAAIEQAFSQVRAARADFLVEMIVAMWHLGREATVTDAELRAADFDRRTRREPDIWEIS